MEITTEKPLPKALSMPAPEPIQYPPLDIG